MTTMLYPFAQLNNNTKFAYAVSSTIKAMRESVVNENTHILGNASDNFTITDYINNNSKIEYNSNNEIYEYVDSLNAQQYDLFIETIFALHNSLSLYKE